MSPFVLGLIAGYGIAIPVGAIAVLIFETGLRQGLRAALAAGAGAASADLLYAILAVVAGAGLAPYVDRGRATFRLAGGVALVAIGLLMLWRLRGVPSVRSAPADLHTAPGAIYAKFLGLTLLNPQTVIYFSSLVLGGGLGQPTVDRLAAFAVGAVLASLSWQWLLAGLSALGRTVLPSGLRLAATALGSLIVVALGVRMLIGD
jgi:arginine exporter protein ArgO